MSLLLRDISLLIRNPLDGRDEHSDIAAGPIGEPYISLIVAQYPDQWRELLELNS